MQLVSMKLQKRVASQTPWLAPSTHSRSPRQWNARSMSVQPLASADASIRPRAEARARNAPCYRSRRDGRAIFGITWAYGVEALEVSHEANARPRGGRAGRLRTEHRDRKSTRLNSSHPSISYAVF